MKNKKKAETKSTSDDENVPSSSRKVVTGSGSGSGSVAGEKELISVFILF